MIPDNRFSTTKHVSPFIGLRADPDFVLTQDRETINVPISTFVYQQQNWIGTLTNNVIVLTCDGQPSILAVNDNNITEFSFTFDQNKRPTVAYVTNGIAKLNWYDTNQSAQVTSILGSTCFSPRVSLDDKHRLASDTNDVILAYIKNSNLCFRQQRDRYQTERVLKAMTANTRLRRIGMNAVNRFQFETYEMFDASISQTT